MSTETKDGEKYFGYGGDFGDSPNDSTFVMDGLCDSLHNPGPGLSEYSQAIQPVQVLGMQGLEITIVNRHDFLTLDHLKCTWDIVSDRNQIIGHDVLIPRGVKPHTQATLVLGGGVPIGTLAADNAFLELEFRQESATSWAPMGHTVARAQVPLRPPASLTTIKSLSHHKAIIPSHPASLPNTAAATDSSAVGSDTFPRVELRDEGRLYAVTISNGTTFGFDTGSGALAHLTHADAPDKNLITQPPKLDFYRALTDNDKGGPFGPEWRERRVHQTRQHFLRMTTSTSSETETGNGGGDDGATVTVTVQSRVAPPALAWAVDATTTYTFTATYCSVRIQARPSGALLPTTFARFGLTLGLRDVRIVEWFGRGPQESYCDKKTAQLFNTWGFPVDSPVLQPSYEVPQDSGNRTDVRWVELRSDWGGTGDEESRLLRARFGDHEGASFSVSRFSAKDIDECGHPYELQKRKREDCLIRLDWYHHGLGTGSCGPATLPQYQLKTDREFDVELLLD